MQMDDKIIRTFLYVICAPLVGIILGMLLEYFIPFSQYHKSFVLTALVISIAYVYVSDLIEFGA